MILYEVDDSGVTCSPEIDHKTRVKFDEKLKFPGKNEEERQGLEQEIRDSRQVARSCLVHPFRPSSCRDWTPSLCFRDCQAGLTKHWGLSLSSSGRLQGPEEKLRDFHSFLESLE